MKHLDTWWSPAGQCWRIEDGEMFTYDHLDDVLAHFRNRQHPAKALLVAKPHDMHTVVLDLALRRAGIEVVYAPA